MGVTTGGLLGGRTQEISITTPPIDADTAQELADKLTEVVQAFNAQYNGLPAEQQASLEILESAPRSRRG